MTTYRSLSRIVALSLAATGMIGGAGTALAADPVLTQMVAVKSLAATTGPTALESVNFSGSATVRSQRVMDPDGQSRLLFHIDMKGVSGVGSSSGASYALWSEEQLTRPLDAAQKFDIIFPFSKAATDPLGKVRTGMASFALNIDTATGAITASSATATAR